MIRPRGASGRGRPWIAALGILAAWCAAAAGDEPGADDRGRELFTRDWSPGDARSRGGDGLGPVFNARSCADCHNQGGIGGSAATHRNIEVISPETPDGPGSAPGFFYAFSMSMGGNRLEYRLGDPTPNPRRGADAIPALDRAALAAVHSGFRDHRDVVLHRFGTDSEYRSWRETVVGRHGDVAIRSSQRNPTPLFGMGLIDAIPDPAIEAAARRRHGNWPGVRGRVSRLPDGSIGKYGWKAQIATLEAFVRQAAAVEMGLEVPGHPQAADPRPERAGAAVAPGLDLDVDDLADLVRFVRELPRPTIAAPADARAARAIKSGRTLFRAVGCAECHAPDLGGVEGIYSDLLLHDMSPRLADSGPYGVFLAEAPARPAAPREARPAAAGEWRTPPLWGLRDSGPYLHDGRAATVEEAVALHGGEADASARRFAQLPARDRRSIEAFLFSLAAPEAPERGR